MGGPIGVAMDEGGSRKRLIEDSSPGSERGEAEEATSDPAERRRRCKGGGDRLWRASRLLLCRRCRSRKPFRTSRASDGDVRWKSCSISRTCCSVFIEAA